MRKTRRLLAAAAAIAGLVALPGPAQAVPPQAVPFRLPLAGTDAVGRDGVCRFPVVIDFLTNQLTPRPHNRFTGYLSATVTRVDTGKTLTFNASGPGTLTNNGIPPFSLNGSGPWLTYTQVKNLPDDVEVPPRAYTNGHLQYSVDANGKTTSYELNGRSTDVCAALS
jgi:hypothetical protein